MYLLCEDFKYGLDTRKFMLNSPAGTLTTLTNAHITPGGEIEKRKAFTRTALPTNCFGLEVTDAGLTVFGSVAQGSLNAALPSGVTYQRLQHPDGSTAMTAVVNSSVFNGNAFVIATFGTGGTFAFYDGVLVYDFFAGRAASWLTSNQALANHLAALVNQSADFSSSSATLVSGSDYKVVITAASGIATTPTQTETSVAGTLTTVTTRTQVDGITGVSAQGQFAIQAGEVSAGTNKVTSVLVGTSELLGASVDYVTNNDATAAAVKDAINTRQSVAVATTNRERTGNVAKLTVAAHKFIVGDIVTIAGVGGTGYNAANVTITAKTSTTISYANTGGNEATTSDTGGTISITSRLYAATVEENVVRIVATATGTAANDKVVSVTVSGAVCIDQYSFSLSMNSTASTTAVPSITAIFLNGVEVLGGAATGADTNAVIADARTKILAYGGGTPVYSAAVDGNTLYISRLTSASDSNPITVIVVVDSQGGVVTSGSFLSVTAGPENLTLFGGAPAKGTVLLGTGISANVQGGVAPYHYEWTAGAVFNGTSATAGSPRLEFLPDNTVRAPQLKVTRTTNDANSGLSNQYTGSAIVKVTDSSTPKALTATFTLPLVVKFYPYTNGLT